MSEPTATTTVSEPRPISALEQTLRDKAGEYRRPGMGLWIQGPDVAYKQAADLAHARDAELLALAEECEVRADRHGDKYTEYDYLAERLRAILEGKTNE